METGWALFFFDTMFRDPESLGGQVDHLASLRERGFLGAQVVLAVLTAHDGMDEDFIRHLHLPQMVSTMAWLPTWLLAAFLP